MTDYSQFDVIIKTAIDEDIRGGDITTQAVINKNIYAEAEFLVKEDGVIAGLDLAERIFKVYDRNLNFEKFYADGDFVKNGNIAAQIKGSAASILTCERTSLNFMQRMSGIASAARLYSDKIKHTKAQILDTRKTAPGLRMLDKMAVKIGGGKNHRIGLFDMFLIKDNHIALSGSIKRAVDLCKKFKSDSNFKIEVEAANLTQVKEALDAGADIIMLDNFSLDEMSEAVKLINGKVKTEASGGVDVNTVVQIAETGVDYISIGALTHSVKALDISLNVKL